MARAQEIEPSRANALRCSSRPAPGLLGCSCAELERTRFGPQAVAKTFTVQQVVRRGTKKPDMYWSAPPDAKISAISVVETGYVRRSEVSCSAATSPLTGCCGREWWADVPYSALMRTASALERGFPDAPGLSAGIHHPSLGTVGPASLQVEALPKREAAAWKSATYVKSRRTSYRSRGGSGWGLPRHTLCRKKDPTRALPEVGEGEVRAFAFTVS